MNNNTREQVFLDLKSNPVINRFFAGWTPSKAISFGQNLLIIGIGVANKLLVNNSPEEAFNKLNKMAQNVSMEYQNLNKYGNSPNKFQIEEYAQQFRNENVSRKKQFEKNQQHHQYNFNENGQQDEKHKMKLKNEINQVKHQLDALNSKLDQQQQHPQSQYISASPDYVEESQNLASQRGRRSKNKKQNQKITLKITESPPPPQQITIIRSMNSLSSPKPHLNDNAIKECFQKQDEEHLYPGSQNPKKGAIPQQYYQNSQPYISANNQFMRSSGMNADYDMSSSKGTQQQQIRSPERLSDAYYSTSQNFRQQNKKEKQRNNSKERLLKKNNHNLGASPNGRNPSQQLGSVRSDKKRPPQYLQNVESRIKVEIQAHRGQHQMNPDQQNPQDNQNQEDFKYMMNEGYNNANNNGNERMDEAKDQIQEEGQNNNENFSNNENPNNKVDENVVEMGVHYSKTAQKKYYEKLEREKQQQQSKEGERKNNFVNQQQQNQQMQAYSVMYNPQQQQQYYRSMASAAGGYSSLSPQSHQNLTNNQQQQQYPNAYQQQQVSNNVIGSDSNRIMMSSHPENFGSGPITSQKNTIYGGNINNMNGTAGMGSKKNMYENANSFLSSPLMRQFIDDDDDNDNDDEEEEEYQELNENDEINQRDDVRDYDDFQYPSASPMNQQYLYQSHPMRQSYINPNNPYNNSMQDPWRQSTGSRVGFNQNPNSSQVTTQNNFYNQQSIESTFGGVGPNQTSQQLPSFNPSVEQYNPSNQEAVVSTNTASFRQQQQQQKMPNKNTQNIKSSQIQQQYQPQSSNQKSLKFSKSSKQNGNNNNRQLQNFQNAYPGVMIPGAPGEDNVENVSEFEPRQSTFITTQYKYDSGQKNSSFAWGQQNQNKYPVAYKNEELFRESINNSDFTMPNEEVQQYFKDLNNFNLK